MSDAGKTEVESWFDEIRYELVAEEHRLADRYGFDFEKELPGNCVHTTPKKPSALMTPKPARRPVHLEPSLLTKLSFSLLQKE